ncbi:MAG: PfkB family carbohydrate kinase [bacterium]|nr:PfkB family carbohydrate kinase [bacterium]
MIKLVVVGHLAVNKTFTPAGENIYFGGAAFHVAWAAAQFLPSRSVGIISVCGRDFDLTPLEKTGVDTSGISINKNVNSDTFVINETKTDRTFEAKGKLCLEVSVKPSPANFKNARFLHLATAPPTQQLKWIEEINDSFDRDKVLLSSDSFELFVRKFPRQTEKVFSLSDLIFANTEEWQMLNKTKINAPLVLKMGEKGAVYFNHGKTVFRVGAVKINKIIDSVGAGEIVAGVFLAMKILGFTEKEALSSACRIASWSLEDFGIEHLAKKEKFLRFLYSVKKHRGVI